VTIVTMTPGDKGSHEMGQDEIAQVRRSEAARAAGLIGAAYHCAEFRDLEIFSDRSSRQRVVELIRKVKPDAILTSSPVDYLCDHETTCLLVRDACFAAPARNYVTGDADPAPPIAAIPHLYYMDPVGGADRDGVEVKPDFVVDVSTTFEVKYAMLACHESQRNWLRHHHGMDNYMISMAQWTRKCGKRAGVEFGEGFRQYGGHPYPESPLLQDALAGCVKSVPD
jgi:LmbE family N-acetylglucosaminyl deacetylase